MKLVMGGSGFLGTAIARVCARQGRCHVSFDRVPARDPSGAHQVVDLLIDQITLPPGDVVLVAGSSMPRVRHPWTLALDNVLTTARLLPQLADRRVVLSSSIEVFGRSEGPGQPAGLPMSDDALRRWVARARNLAEAPCPPWRAAALCAEIVDPDGRWTYALAKRAQELLLIDALDPSTLTIVRLANLFGPGQERVVSRLTNRAMAGLPLRVSDTSRYFVHVDDVARYIVGAPAPGMHMLLGTPVSLVHLAELVQDVVGSRVPVTVLPRPSDDVDVAALNGHSDQSPAAVESNESALRQFVSVLVAGRCRARLAIPVVVPPRPDRPDVVAERQQESLWSGRVKYGNRWTRALGAALSEHLQLDAERTLLLCASGTAALRLAVVATVGTATPGDVAVLPSFTFAATAEALVQLGYRLRFVDVDADTWTMDVAGLERALALPGAAVVVSVDTLGGPADYDRLLSVCQRAGVPLVADSAPALGARYAGRPIGTQAAAHAFSMSFAKVVSAGGAGGALTLRAADVERISRPVDWLRSAQLGELPAAVALEQVERLEELIRHRAEVAAVYDEYAAARDDVIGQVVRAGDRHAMVHWVGRFPGVDRADLQRLLSDAGIGTNPYYSPALHLHDWGGHAEPATDLPVTAALAEDALALPMSSELTAEDAERVIGELNRALTGARRRRAAFPGPRTPRVQRVHAHKRIDRSSSTAVEL